MEEFINRLKKEPVTFYGEWVPYEKEKDMSEERFTGGMSSMMLKDSIKVVNDQTIADINEDIEEITRKRKQIFEELKELHRKESMLVGQLRSLQLQGKLVD